MSPLAKKNWIAIVTGVILFAIMFSTKLLILNYLPFLPTFYRLMCMEALLAASSILTARYLFNIPSSNFSIYKGFIGKIAFRYAKYVFVLGLIATSFMMGFKMPIISQLKDLNLLQYILIMLVASVSEEILTRGLVQGIVDNQIPIFNIRNISVSGGVFAGAIVFSLIHSNIYLSGGNLVTCLTVMFFAFFIGLAAGKAKEQSNLGTAILTHLSFNIGGALAGIIINTRSMIITGHALGD